MDPPNNLDPAAKSGNETGLKAEPAALFGVALAGVIALLVEPGSWGWMSTIATYSRFDKANIRLSFWHFDFETGFETKY